MSEQVGETSQLNLLDKHVIYRNTTHKKLRYTCSIASIAMSVIALATGITSCVLIEKYGDTIVDPVSKRVEMNVKEFIGLYALATSICPLIIVGSIIAFYLSTSAMKHERTGTLEEQEMKRTGMQIILYLMIFLSFCAMGLQLATTIMASRDRHLFDYLNHGGCSLHRQVSRCEKLDVAYDLMMSTGILTCLSITMLLMLSTTALSHIGSTKRLTLHSLAHTSYA